MNGICRIILLVLRVEGKDNFIETRFKAAVSLLQWHDSQRKKINIHVICVVTRLWPNSHKTNVIYKMQISEHPYLCMNNRW